MKADRREALQAAKLAVRAYAREPSSDNARRVALAWQRVRQHGSVARRRQPTATGRRPASLRG